MKHTACILLCLTIGGGAQAETIFSEDFNDGRFHWSQAHLGLEPRISATSGDLIIEQESIGEDQGTIVWANSEPRVLDTSTRAQMSLEGSGGIGIVTRANNTVLTWMQAGFRADVQALYLGWNTVGGFTDFLEPVSFPHDFSGGRDLVMQLDVFGNDYHLFAWPAGELPPAEPQLVFTNEQIELEEGVPGWQVVVDRNLPGTTTKGILRHLIVADQPLVFGDLNTDAVIDAHDIDDLSKRIRQNDGFDFAYDANGDREVSESDRDFWVAQVQQTYFGDANLDGEFNSQDFVTVFQSGTYEQDLSANWADGDWSGDGRFDSQDFVIAFQDGGYEQGPRPSSVAVPEPSTYIQLLIVSLAAMFNRRSRGGAFSILASCNRGLRWFRD